MHKTRYNHDGVLGIFILTYYKGKKSFILVTYQLFADILHSTVLCCKIDLQDQWK
jgi:hypothetical protein